MPMKVKSITGTETKTVSTLELTKDLPLTEKVKTRIKRDVGDFLVESIVSTVGGAASPVAGEAWPKLSKGYKKLKLESGLPDKANMEFEGDMLDALTYKTTDDGIDIGFFNRQAWKADGHLKFSGEKNNIPKRRFLPGVGQKFDSDIQSGVEQIITDALNDAVDFTSEDFNQVTTRAELYDVLGEQFPGLSRAEIRATVARTPKLAGLLESEGVLELL